ncbi:hypothetical protein SAMN04488118_104160 [Epibacterium ulvae]|uniref:Uncharacterized protein n=1 Tax=Epibacterium ulvae TaxID=1156985 RepID=A0A1G5QH20_9RHOB|nr:hypothetical protein [Epibacterium ulvae]SCZ60830.1 hypothetical protein SAMN04488118_104160 [Epibacterium ulvae]
MKKILFALALLIPNLGTAQNFTKDFVVVGNCNPQSVIEYRDHLNALIDEGKIKEKEAEAITEREIGELKRSDNVDDHFCVILKAVYDEFGLTFK